MRKAITNTFFVALILCVMTCDAQEIPPPANQTTQPSPIAQPNQPTQPTPGTTVAPATAGDAAAVQYRQRERRRRGRRFTRAIKKPFKVIARPFRAVGRGVRRIFRRKPRGNRPASRTPGRRY